MASLAWTADVVAFAEQALSAADPEELTGSFRDFMRSKGMSGLACGEIDLRDLGRTVMLAAHWPADWMEFYTREGLVFHDPAVTSLGRLNGVLDWKTLRIDCSVSVPRRRAILAAEDYGWRDGVFVPLPRGGSRWGLATVTTTEGTLSPEERAETAAALALFYERLRGLAAGRPPAKSFSGLTPRELDCLALVARGCGDEAIGERLGIARSTAHDHIERAKRRLRVTTRTEAVAIAVSLGLVSL